MSVDSGPTGGCVGFCTRDTGSDQSLNFFPNIGPRSWNLIQWTSGVSTGPLHKTPFFTNFRTNIAIYSRDIKSVPTLKLGLILL